MNFKVNISLNDLSTLLSTLQTKKYMNLGYVKTQFIKNLIGRDDFESINKIEAKMLKKSIFDHICQKLGEEEKADVGENLHLDLRKQEKENLKNLNESIKKNNFLKELSLSIDGESMKIIFEAIKSNKSLQILRIREIEDNVAAFLLSRALKSNGSLQSISFSSNNLKENSAKFVFKFLKKNESIKTIQLTLLKENELKFFFKNVKKNDKLTKLILKRNQIGTIGALKISQYLNSNQNLTFLDLSFCHIGNEGIKFLSESIKNHQGIREVEFFSLEAFGSEGIKYFSESLKNNKFLTKIDLNSNYINDDGIKFFVESLKLNSTLKILDLSFNRLEDKSLKYFSKFLSTNNSLKILNFSENNFDTAGMKLLSDSLSSNKSLEELNLSRNQLSKMEMKAFSEFLKFNKTLKVLDLKENMVGNGGVEYIFENLKQNQHLESLNVSENDIEEEGMKHISECLLVNQNLKILDISNNFFGENGVEYLSNSLKHNSTLKEIYLENFQFEKTNENYFFDFIVDVLKINNSIVKMDINDSSSCIKYLLDCNKQWTIENHKYCPKLFKNGVFVFNLCLKLIEKNLQFKLGKFIVFEMIKRINRKAYFDLDFPKVLKEQDTFIDRKRKRDDSEKNEN